MKKIRGCDRCFSRRTHEAETRYLSAIAVADRPTSLPSNTHLRRSIE